MLFSVEERERVRDRLVGMARSDPRVVACALVGADARGEADRWSDVDLTFAVGGGAKLDEVVDGWTRRMEDDFGAVHLFDLPVAATLYRVFLLEGNLQVDLSFTPAADFGPRGPHFRLVFGSAGDGAPVQPPSPSHLFGFAAHHAVRARFCIERGRTWEAAYWIGELRDEALALACLRAGLPTAYGRGFDRLPAAVLDAAEEALVRSTGREELLRALRAAVELLLRHAGDLDEATRLAGQLRELTDPDAV